MEETYINHETDLEETITTEQLDEALGFCNGIREAGDVDGVDLLHALMPAQPTVKDQCLIAKALNFNCSIYAYEDEYYDDNMKAVWGMFIPDAEIRNKIAYKLDLEVKKDWDDTIGIMLPEFIADIASAYDNWWDSIRYRTEEEAGTYAGDKEKIKVAKKLLKESPVFGKFVDEKILQRIYPGWVEVATE